MRAAAWILCLLLLSSCSARHLQHLPLITDVESGHAETELRDRCESLFVDGDFQQVHGIRFLMANGRGATVVGVTVRDGDMLKCGLMGVEGFVLFEAVLGDTLEVQRALPPFDNPAFAAGLMDDVRTLFLQPEGDSVSCGMSDEGEQLCRYEHIGGKVTDIIVSDADTVYITMYDDEKKRVKSVVFRSFTETEIGRIPEEMELTAPGSRGYTLKVNLISAEKI